MRPTINHTMIVGLLFAQGGLAYAETPAPLPPAVLSSSVSGNLSNTVTTETGSETAGINRSKTSNIGELVEVDGASGDTSFSAAALTTPGAAHARAATTRQSGDPFSSSASASAQSNFTDYVVITGGTGEATAAFSAALDGTLGSDNGSGFSSVNFNVNYSPVSFDSCFPDCPSQLSQTLASESLFNSGVDGNKSYTITYDTEFTFAYDVPFRIDMALSTTSNDGSYADFFSTGLINSLVLPQGATLVSASGFDYNATAVPEPETYAMLLAGLGLVGMAARRRMS